MGDHRRRGLAIAAAVACGVLATGGGLALASKKPAKTIPPAADGTITACARHQDGRLRLVANASKCTKKEQVVTWNQKGPGGTADDPGSVVVGELTLNGVTVPIHAFSFGATNTVTLGGSGGGAGKVKVADIEILKDIDGLTIDTTDAVFTGQHLTSVLVVLFNPGTTTPRATYNFQTVFPDGTQQFSAGALERLTFAYEKVTVTIGADHFSYDLRQGKKF
jgi:hypothetical protein